MSSQLFVGCGVRFIYNSFTFNIESAAISQIKPVISTDVISVESDDNSFKSGRITSDQGTLTRNNKVEIKLSFNTDDLLSLRTLRGDAGKDTVIAQIRRVDLFTTNEYGVQHNVKIISFSKPKRISGGFWSALLVLEKVA